MKRIIKIIPMMIIIIYMLSQVSYAKEIPYETDTKIVDSFFGNLFGDKLLYNTRKSLTKEERQKNNNKVIIITVVFAIYWGVLLLIFEKEDDDPYEYCDEKELLKKYTPLIAGCMVDNRDVLSRDVTATILNLANKGIVKLDIIPTTDKKRRYIYNFSRIKNEENKMTETEKYVHSWFFDGVYLEEEKVDFTKRLRQMSGQKESYDKLMELNKKAKKELSKIGANQNKVPLGIRLYNFLLLFTAICVCSNHIANNGLNLQIYESTVLIFFAIVFLIILIMPLVVLAGYVVFNIMAYGKRVVNLINEKFTGQKIVSTIISICAIFLIIIVLTAIFAESKYLIIDEILLGVTILIVRTDNLMLKNDKKILKDYYNLKRIKEKLEDYTLLNEKDVEYIKLWEEYFTYAVSFGISIEVIKKIKHIYEDDILIEQAQDMEALYSISKAYLEIMFEMEFSNQNKDKERQKNSIWGNLDPSTTYVTKKEREMIEWAKQEDIWSWLF